MDPDPRKEIGSGSGAGIEMDPDQDPAKCSGSGSETLLTPDLAVCSKNGHREHLFYLHCITKDYSIILANLEKRKLFEERFLFRFLHQINITNSSTDRFSFLRREATSTYYFVRSSVFKLT